MYDAYGNIGSGEDASQPFRYTGRRFDAETGLYYYRARYYSATLGRFLQTDPIGYEDNMNLYGYTNNDPINNTDPTGMFGDRTQNYQPRSTAPLAGLETKVNRGALHRATSVVNGNGPVRTAANIVAGGSVALPAVLAAAPAVAGFVASNPNASAALASGGTAAYNSITGGDTVGQTIVETGGAAITGGKASALTRAGVANNSAWAGAAAFVSAEGTFVTQTVSDAVGGEKPDVFRNLIDAVQGAVEDLLKEDN